MFSGSKYQNANVGSCRAAVRETRVEMQVEVAFTGTTISLISGYPVHRVQLHARAFDRSPSLGDETRAAVTRPWGHESPISHEEVSEGEQKEKRQGTIEI